MNDAPFCRATAPKFRNRIKYTKEKQGLTIQVFPISSVTVSLISFLSVEIQSVSLVIYARFLYHYGITSLSLVIWIKNRNYAYTHL